MAFVYRYLDKRNTVKYVGLATGSTMAGLHSRTRAHAKDPAYKGWRCEYIDGLTVTDAKMLENHFIWVHRETIINKQQLYHGPLTCAELHHLEWKPDPPQIGSGSGSAVTSAGSKVSPSDVAIAAIEESYLREVEKTSELEEKLETLKEWISCLVADNNKLEEQLLQAWRYLGLSDDEEDEAR